MDVNRLTLHKSVHKMLVGAEKDLRRRLYCGAAPKRAEGAESYIRRRIAPLRVSSDSDSYSGRPLRMLHVQCESKKNPPEVLWQFFQNGWEFFDQILRAYYCFSLQPMTVCTPNQCTM